MDTPKFLEVAVGDQVTFGPRVSVNGSSQPPVTGKVLDTRDGWAIIAPDADRVSIMDEVYLERDDGSPLIGLAAEYRWISASIEDLTVDLGMTRVAA
jgi:hypothetical protein